MWTDLTDWNELSEYVSVVATGDYKGYVDALFYSDVSGAYKGLRLWEPLLTNLAQQLNPALGRP